MKKNEIETFQVLKTLESFSYIHHFNADVLAMIYKIKTNSNSLEQTRYETDGSMEVYHYSVSDGVRDKVQAKLFYKDKKLESLEVNTRFFKVGYHPFEVGSYVLKTIRILPTSSFETVYRVEKEYDKRSIYRRNGHFTEENDFHRYLEYYQKRQQVSSFDVSPIKSNNQVLKRTKNQKN